MQSLCDIIFGGSFLPYGYWRLWTPGLIRLRIASEIRIALSILMRLQILSALTEIAG